MGSLLQDDTFPAEGTLGTAQNRGNAFVAPADPPPIKGMRWYRAAVGSNRTPQTMRLYDQTNGTSVSPTSIVDPGTVGWHDCPFAADFSLVPGRDYIAAYGWNNGQTLPNGVTSDPGTPPLGFTWESPEFRYSSNGPNSYPDQSLDNVWCPVDIYWEDAPTNGPPPDGPSGEPGEPPQIADLSWWLHKDSVNPDSTVLLTKIVADTIKTTQDTHTASIATIIGAVTGTGGATAMTRLAELLALIAGATGVAANVAQMWESLTNGGLYEQMGVDMQNLQSQALLDAGRRTQPVGESGWLLEQTLSGSGSVVWDVPADAYILTRTGWDANRKVNIYEGHTYFFDRGWWSPSQDGLIDGYGTLASEKHILRSGDTRMRGVLIVQDPDFEWTLEAYNYVGSGA